MKALIYKELKLALHPVCYIFVLLFPFMILIPSYPLGTAFIYVLASYPILFLGANKGQQSNDLLYSVLQPVRKKDIVLARIITVLLMQVVTMLLMCALFPLATYINGIISQQAIASGTKAPEIPGLGYNAFVSILAFGLITFALSDLIFFPIYYHKGRSIVMSTILMIVGFTLVIFGFTLIIPLFSSEFKSFFSDNLGLQFGFLGIAIVLTTIIHCVIYRISSKELEKVDF